MNDFLGYFPPAVMFLALLKLVLPFIVIALSAVFGAGALAARTETLLLALLLAGNLLPRFLILLEERFQLTLIPFFAISAAALWTKGFSALGLRSPVFLVASRLIAALLLANWGFHFTREGFVLSQMLDPNGNQLFLQY